MDKLLKLIMDYVGTHGLGTVLIVVIVVFAIVYLRRYLDLQLKKLEAKPPTPIICPEYRTTSCPLASIRGIVPIDQEGLQHHYFFSRLDYWIEVDIPHISIMDRFRRTLFIDMLLYKFKTIKTFLVSFINSEDLASIGKDEFQSKVSNLLVLMISEYEDIYKREQIPSIAIQKFNMWHADRVEFMANMVTDISNSDFYATNIIRFAVVLNVFEIILHSTILDAEKTLKSLNGELLGTEYKGIKCEERRHSHPKEGKDNAATEKK